MTWIILTVIIALITGVLFGITFGYWFTASCAVCKHFKSDTRFNKHTFKGKDFLTHNSKTCTALALPCLTAPHQTCRYWQHCGTTRKQRVNRFVEPLEG